MQCEIATVSSTDKEIENILKETKTIAIVGCSPDTSKASNKVASYLKNAGYTIIPIYPKEDEILGEKVYRSLSDIPSDIQIDMVDIFRKSAVIASVIDEVLLRTDVKCIWTQLGLVNNEAAKKASDAGFQVVQNKCTKIEHANLLS